MSQTLRKKITIKSNCSISLYGGTFGPIRSPFYETVTNIARLIGDGIEVYEETANGKIRLTMANFDADNNQKDQPVEEQREPQRVDVQEPIVLRNTPEQSNQSKNNNNNQNKNNRNSQNKNYQQKEQAIDAVVEE